MSSKSEYCLKIPKLENLCCINCKVNYHTMWDSALKSTYHNKILICRLILYSVRCCIASPSTRNLDCIHIIISKKFYSTKKMQNYLINLKIQFTDPQPVCPKIYAACLKYTFTFKLGPIWNLVGKSFYLNRFNFLSYSSTTKAIECNISFKGTTL